MSSCSASSNIQGTSTVLNPTGSEARISLKLLASAAGSATGYTLDSNIFAGGVVRYTPSLKTYFLSQADNNENSEVVGVAESKDANGDVTVILRGLIEYPAGATLNNISFGGAAGGSGGNDIWFLSAATAGEMQNLEPSDVSQIVKPVMQAIASSDNYNYQVINYIGYAVGGEIVSDEGLIPRLPIGSAVIVPDDVNLPVGWVYADKEREIPVTKYPQYYSYTGKNNGYVEKVTLKSSPPASVISKGFSQKSAGSIVSSGRVKSIDTLQKQIFVRKSSSSTSTNIINDLTLGGVNYGVPTSVEVQSIFSPKITPGATSTLTYYENGRVVTKNQKVILKIQDVSGVSVPSNVTVKEMFVTDKFTVGNSGASFADVADEITRIKSRLTTLENKVTGIS